MQEPLIEFLVRPAYKAPGNPTQQDIQVITKKKCESWQWGTSTDQLPIDS